MKGLRVSHIFGTMSKRAVCPVFDSTAKCLYPIQADELVLCLPISGRTCQELRRHQQQGASLAVYYRYQAGEGRTRTFYGKIMSLMMTMRETRVHLKGQTVNAWSFHSTDTLPKSLLRRLQWSMDQRKDFTWDHFRLWYLFELERERWRQACQFLII
jgi:hypothetical protein